MLLAALPHIRDPLIARTRALFGGSHLGPAPLLAAESSMMRKHRSG
jgi:hypothetical protein